MKSLPHRRLLLIDDHREVLRALELSLEVEGFEVVTAQTARDAESLLLRETFDLVVCDYLLTETDGVSFKRRMEGIMEIPPFLFCSGMKIGSPEEAFIAKPFVISDLIRKINLLCKPLSKNDHSSSIATCHTPPSPSPFISPAFLSPT